MEESKVRALFDAMVGLSHQERDTLLGRQSDVDSEIVARVQALLAAHDCASGYMSQALAASILERSPETGVVYYPEVSGFEFVKSLGSGTFGSVYQARQLDPVREVALKVLHNGLSGVSQSRFKLESDALASMQHSHIATIYESGYTTAGQPYLAMELVVGLPLTRYCEERDLDVATRIALFMEVCDAVHHAHQRGIIHRDLKPSNILVRGEVDSKAIPKVIDFGIAKFLTSQSSAGETVDGQILGTPEYMSPEQARGELSLDTRSDVYSLGAILYELLTGSPPFKSEALRANRMARLLAVIEHELPTRPSHRVTNKSGGPTPSTDAHDLRSLRDDLDWIVLKALRKDRSERYESVAALSHDLSRFLNHEPVLARAPSRSYQLRKLVRRHCTLVITSSLLVASLILGLAGTLGALFWALKERDVATEANNRVRDAAIAERMEREKTAAARDSLDRLARLQASSLASIDAREIALRLEKALLDQLPKNLRATQQDSERVARERMALKSALWSADLVQACRTALAETLLDTVSKNLAQSSLGSLGAESRLLKTLATGYEALDRGSAAIESWRRIAEIAPALKDLRLELRANAKLVVLHSGLGNQAKAEQAMQKLEQLVSRTDDPYWPVAAMQTKGIAAVRRGDIEHGLELLVGAHTRYVELYGAGSARALQALSHVASAAQSLGDTSRALEYQRLAYNGLSAALGDNCDRTASVRLALAESLIVAGDHTGAEKHARATHEFYRERRGESCDEALRSTDVLAKVAMFRGQHEQGVRLAKRCYETALAIYGERHPRTLHLLSTYAHSLGDADREPEALELCGQLLEVAEPFLGRDHPLVVDIVEYQGVLHWNQRELADAEKCVRDAIARRKRAFGNADLRLLDAEATLAGIVGDLGRKTEACETLAALYPKSAAVRGRMNVQTIILARSLGLAYLANEQDSDAVEWLTRAIDDGSEVIGADHAYIAVFRSERAMAQCALGEFHKSLADSEAAYPTLLAAHGEGHYFTTRCANTGATACQHLWQGGSKAHEAELEVWRARGGKPKE